MRDLRDIDNVVEAEGVEAVRAWLDEGYDLIDVQAHRDRAATYVLGKPRPLPPPVPAPVLTDAQRELLAQLGNVLRSLEQTEARYIPEGGTEGIAFPWGQAAKVLALAIGAP